MNNYHQRYVEPDYHGPYPYKDIMAAHNHLIQGLNNANAKMDRIKPKLYINSRTNGIAYPAPAPIGEHLLTIPGTYGCNIIQSLNHRVASSAADNGGLYEQLGEADDIIADNQVTMELDK